MDRLTPRQREVIELACREGLVYKEIAARLGITPNMTKNHAHEAFVRVGAANGAGSLGAVCYILGREDQEVETVRAGAMRADWV